MASVKAAKATSQPGAAAAAATTTAAPPAKISLNASVAGGKKIYTQYCLSCHMADGGGVQNMNPPLSKTAYVNGDKMRLISVLLKGLSRQEIEGETYTNVMASFSFMTDQQIADVLTFVRSSFLNKSSAVTAGEVKAARLK